MSNLKCYSVRIGPGSELKSSLLKFVRDQDLKAPFILSCVGSLSKATLRMAKPKGESGEEVHSFDNFYEILSLTGNLSGERGHIHISLGDKEGKVIGGHVMGDLVVYTTAEVVIGECTDIVFSREMDATTGFPELTISNRQPIGE